MGTKKQESQNGTPNVSMSADSMTAMVSADVSIKQANVQGSTAKKMEGRANVLEVEITLDSSRGGSSNVGLKEAELADAKEAAEKATTSQLESLAQAGETMKKAAESDKANHRTEDEEKEEKNVSGETKDSEKPTEGASDVSDSGTLEEQVSYGYHPVDVRL